MSIEVLNHEVCIVPPVCCFKSSNNTLIEWLELRRCIWRKIRKGDIHYPSWWGWFLVVLGRGVRMSMAWTVIDNEDNIAPLDSHFMIKIAQIFIPQSTQHPGLLGVAVNNGQIMNIDSIPAESLWCLEFVTGRGGAGFHLPGPALITSRGGYFGGDPHPAPVRGESPLIPWMGLRFSPPVLTGTRLGNRRGREQGQGTVKYHAPPRAVQRGGAGNWASSLRFSGPQRPRNEH